MNRITATLYLTLLVLLTVTMEGRAADAASSRPAGFIKVNVVSNQQTMVAYPFSPFDAGIQSVLNTQLTGGTNEATSDRVFKYNAQTMRYEEAGKNLAGQWLASFNPATASDMTFEQGTAIWILSRQKGAQPVVLAGEVVLENTNNTVLYPGPNAVAYPFTTASASNELTSTGALIDPVTLKPVTNMNLGSGYWFNNNSGASVLWAEMRPYGNPFPTNDSTPQILGVSVDKQGHVVLTGAGTPKTDVDIMWKDLTPTGVVQMTWGWNLAGTVNVKDDGSIEWTDNGKSGMTSPDQIFGRLYLIGSALDANKDGIHDAIAMFTRKTPPATPEAPVWGDPSFVDPAGPVDGVTTNSLGGTNGVPVAGSRHSGKIFHVSKKIGKDTLNGLSPVIVGNDGPKKKIKAALDTASAGDHVVIHEGEYHEALNLAGRDVHVRIEGSVRLLPTVPAGVTNVVTGVGTNNVPATDLDD